MLDNKTMHEFINYAKSIYGDDFIPLHRPIFKGNEKKYLIECIDSNYVSSVGSKVTEFEQKIADYTGSKYAIATVNGTSALHIAIQLAEVQPGDEVLTQALTFIATCNAISYTRANPVFIDVDKDTLGMSPKALSNFLKRNVVKRKGEAFNINTGKKISACVPMHTFGMPCRINEIVMICAEWNIPVIEDIAESLGSFVGDCHTGTSGLLATLSFNGNKIITTGGGGMIITDDYELAKKAKHITTTAKVPHPYDFVHDQIGYNYRMPNLNAAIGCAQMEHLSEFLIIKDKITKKWQDFFELKNIELVKAVKGTTSNNWLNAIILDSKDDRDKFLNYTNDHNVMTRPIWTLMSKLSMFNSCQKDELTNSLWLEDRVVNVPSSVPDNFHIQTI